MIPDGADRTAKYLSIYRDLKQTLTRGDFKQGDRLPTEHDLARHYSVSRPTVTRALNALKEEGLIHRRTGSGSYVAYSEPDRGRTRLFGLLVPGLGRGEIFEPICAQIASLANANNFSLLWSGAGSNEPVHRPDLARTALSYVEHGVAGVFFAPLEWDSRFEATNRRIASIYEDAGIPIVLIDTDYVPFPQRSGHDLVGIDNFRSGYLVTSHLLSHGCDRVDFLMRPDSSFTVDVRRRGYQAALLDQRIVPQEAWTHVGDPSSVSFMRDRVIHAGGRNIVCANDETAAMLLESLMHLGIHVPDEVRIVGINDVRYSRHLRIPLTTLRQPCADIGTLAVETMLSRLENPRSPARTVSATGELVVRKSCGPHGE